MPFVQKNAPHATQSCTHTTQTIGGHHFKKAVVDGQQGNIKRATTKVKHEDVLFTSFVESIGNSGGGGLIDAVRKQFANSN